MKNVVILIYSVDDAKRLSDYVRKEDVEIVSAYNRADWQNQPKRMPLSAQVVRIKNPKKEFEIRMKFDTFPHKGVEF